MSKHSAHAPASPAVTPESNVLAGAAGPAAAGSKAQGGLFRQIATLLNPRERRHAALLLLLMIAQALAELVGVASIAPFMAVVANTSIIQTNGVLAYLYQLGGFGSDTAFLTALGILVVVTLTLTNSLVSLTTWASNRFVWGMHHRLGVRLLSGYLAQPYGFFIQRNTASLNKNILGEVQITMQQVMLPLLNVISRSLVALAIIGLLVFMDPVLAVAVSVSLGGIYGVVYLLIRRKQARLGRLRTRANEQRFKLAGEAFGGIKDVKVLQREADFVRRFAGPSWDFSRAMAINTTISVIPRYLLETVGFGSVVIIVVYYLQSGHGLGAILPTLSLYAFAGMRLMPAMQTIFGALTTIRFNRAQLAGLVADFRLFAAGATLPLPAGQALQPQQSPAPLPFEKGVFVKQLSFTFPEGKRRVLDGLTLEVPRNHTIGLVGSSGAGKTTLVDLLLGLYEPDDGSILIDDRPLGPDTLPGWRRQIGYVPQHIFLTDDSLRNNIAFGVPPAEIDDERIRQAATIAHLDGFIQTLPEQYDTIVGERGVRLSGGQRQRIGIARAVYHDPAVLIMDEATSALDGETEDAVMEAIKNLAGHKTIILIAHRLTTIEECDCIYLLGQGRVLASGTYSDLVQNSPDFRAMARMT